MSSVKIGCNCNPHYNDNLRIHNFTRCGTNSTSFSFSRQSWFDHYLPYIYEYLKQAFRLYFGFGRWQWVLSRMLFGGRGPFSNSHVKQECTQILVVPFYKTFHQLCVLHLQDYFSDTTTSQLPLPMVVRRHRCTPYSKSLYRTPLIFQLPSSIDRMLLCQLPPTRCNQALGCTMFRHNSFS